MDENKRKQFRLDHDYLLKSNNNSHQDEFDFNYSDLEKIQWPENL
jgi:hypothetical protein